jgi:L-ascorbate metabolism protein UlaG (beta-lactamase superfamily)
LSVALELTYLGHSAFRLRGKDVTIVTDPHPPELGAPMGKPSAHVVTISHKSPNHSYSQGVAGNPRIVSGPGEYELADTLIAGVATSMEPRVGPTNTAYVFRVEDMNICHLGDLRDKLTDKQIEEIGSIDVLLVPVGGGSAIGPAKAATVITQLEPSVVVPMHYRVDGVQADSLEPVDLFCREVGLKDYVPEPKLSVTKGSLTNEVRIVVLENKRV